MFCFEQSATPLNTHYLDSLTPKYGRSAMTTCIIIIIASISCPSSAYDWAVLMVFWNSLEIVTILLVFVWISLSVLKNRSLGWPMTRPMTRSMISLMSWLIILSIIPK